MSYQVFARKWRPKKFSDIVGQHDVITAIKHSFNLNRVHHAYILSGTRGIGKTTIARLFAKGLSCEQGSRYNMCGCCRNCKDIESSCFIDLIEIDAAYYTRVEDIREFLENVQYAPSRGKFKIYLIDEVHMLSKHSFNALLKIIEEPPQHVKFILVTTDYQKLPETIISRCLLFYLKPLSISQIVNQLLHICSIEQIKIDEDSLKLLAYEAQGSMRDALNVLEQAILFSNNNVTLDKVNHMFGFLNIEKPLLLIESLIDGNIDSLMSQIDSYSVLGINWDALIKQILTIFQKIAITQFSLNFFQKQMSNDNNIKNIVSRIYNLSTRIKPEHVQLYYQIFLLSRRELPYAPSYRMGIEMAILRALAFSPSNINSDNSQDNFPGFLCNKNDNNSFSKKNSESLVDNFNTINTSNNVNNVSNSITYKKAGNACKDSSLKVQTVSTDPVINEMPNFISKVLNIRSKLIQQQQRFNKFSNTNVELNSNVISKVTKECILDRFFSIHLDIKNKNFDNKKKIIKLYH